MCFPLREPLVRIAESIEDLLGYFEYNAVTKIWNTLRVLKEAMYY